jgi:hypothetical protein
VDERPWSGIGDPEQSRWLTPEGTDQQRESVTFLTNPAGLSDARLDELADLATQDAHAQLALVADDLIATLAEQRGKDGRNVAVTALRKRLAFVQRLIQRCTAQLDPPDAATLGPGSGTHPKTCDHAECVVVTGHDPGCRARPAYLRPQVAGR